MLSRGDVRLWTDRRPGVHELTSVSPFSFHSLQTHCFIPCCLLVCNLPFTGMSFANVYYERVSRRLFYRSWRHDLPQPACT